MTDKTDSKEREAIARAMWSLMREHEDRCDEELEDLEPSHPIWAYADMARATLAAGSEPEAWIWKYANGEEEVVFVRPERVKDMHPDTHDMPSKITPLYLHPSPPEGMVGGWMPIETAPKDGTAILLGSRGGSWIGKWLPVYVSGYRPENPWSSLMLNHDHMGEKWCKPTHWMPLPPPPTSSADRRKGE